MSDLRRKLIRLAHANPELRADILPLLRESSDKIARWDRWEKVIVGPNVRISYSTGRHATMRIEEMHQKGKKKLRRVDFDIGSNLPNPGDHPNAWLIENLVMWMKPSKSMTYDQAKAAFLRAMDTAEEKAENDSRGRVLPDWSQRAMTRMMSRPNEELLTAWMVEPADYAPITAEGRDFTISSEWGSFGTYSPSSDFQQADPHYTKIEAKSPSAARKLYKVLKSQPDALRNVSFNELGDWLSKMKIAWKYQFSVYR